MATESTIVDFIYNYQDESLRFLQGVEPHYAKYENRLYVNLPHRPEKAAIESFLIIPCLDGHIAYGFPKSMERNPNLPIKNEQGIDIVTEKMKVTLSNLLSGIGAYPIHSLSLLSRETYCMPKIGFAAYLVQHSHAETFQCSFWHRRHHYNQLGYRWREGDFEDQTGYWISIFAFGKGANTPNPRELASFQWHFLNVERNLGSLSSAEKLSRLFNQLLDESTHEEEVQLFLEDHPEIITPDYIKSRPKFRLADKNVTDFVILNRDGYEFIEIERPDKPIFTKGNQLTHQVTQAENQIHEWQILIETDHAFFERRLQGLYRPRYRLIYGRDRELTPEQRKKLSTHFQNIRFDTYDAISERFKLTIENLQKRQQCLRFT